MGHRHPAVWVSRSASEGVGGKCDMVFVAIGLGVLVAAVLQEVVIDRLRLRRTRSLRARGLRSE